MRKSIDTTAELDSARLRLLQSAVEVEDMLARIRSIDATDAATHHPDEVVVLWRALTKTRSAFLHLEQAIRERRIAGHQHGYRTAPL